MKPICKVCNQVIFFRDSRAKLCFPCAATQNKRNGGRRAIYAVKKAIKAGLLAPVKTLVCVDCGAQARCYDHRDYNKPLEVEPVCVGCNVRRGKAVYVQDEIL